MDCLVGCLCCRGVGLLALLFDVRLFWLLSCWVCLVVCIRWSGVGGRVFLGMIGAWVGCCCLEL